MVNKCAIPACSQKWAPNGNLSFHQFPVDKQKFKIWLAATKVSKHILKPRSVICSKHFKESDYHYGPNSKKLLNQDAVPNLNCLKKTSRTKSCSGNRRNDRTLSTKNERSTHFKVTQIKNEPEVNKTKNVKSNSKISQARNERNTSLNSSSHRPQRNNIRKSINHTSNTTAREPVSNNSHTDRTRKRDEPINRMKTEIKQEDSKSVKRKYSEDCLPVLKKFEVKKCKFSKVCKRVPCPKDKAQRNETSTSTVSSCDKRYWTSIQETITEMKEKIKSLESKSLADEKKIENFQKILLEQKKDEIKGIFGGKGKQHLLRMDALCLNYDPKRMCRLCLLEKIEPLIPLFQPRRKSQLIEKIKTWTGIKVEKGDGMPNSICYECSIQMERAHWFKKRSGNADALIKKFIQIKKTANTMREFSKTMSFYQEDEEPIVQNPYLTEPFPGVKIEIEDVFSLKNIVEETGFEFNVKEEFEGTSYVEDSETKSLNIFNETVAAVNPQQILESIHSKIKFCSYCNKPVYKCLKKKAHGFQCFECGKVFWDREALNRHCILRFMCISHLHERTCNVCNVIFRWKWQLNIHYWQHSKIKSHSCMICGEQFTFLKQLKKHVSSHFS